MGQDHGRGGGRGALEGAALVLAAAGSRHGRRLARGELLALVLLVALELNDHILHTMSLQRYRNEYSRLDR